jgi:hypothetical protein
LPGVELPNRKVSPKMIRHRFVCPPEHFRKFPADRKYKARIA